MKRNKIMNIASICMGIAIILTVIIGISYAYWQITHKQKGTNSIKSGCFELTFEELSDAINLANAFPITDQEGYKTQPYTFKITNICSINTKYNITLNTLSTNTTKDESIKVSLGTDNPNGLLLNNLSINNDTSNIDISNLGTSYIVKTGYLLVGETVTYNLRLWMDENAGLEEMNKIFQSKIVITSVVTEFATLIETTTSMPATGNFLNGPIIKSSIESIDIMDSNKVPVDAIGSWDVSEQKDGSIMAWYYDLDANGLYEVYIGQNGGVIANKNSTGLFSNLTKLKRINLEHLNTSRVTNMYQMFAITATSDVLASLLTDLDLSNFDTSNVINMSYMFSELRLLTSLNVSSFDTSNVTTMKCMFLRTWALTSLDLSNFNTSSVTIMEGMFLETSALTSLNVSSFATSNVTNMSSMFYKCSKLTSLDLSNFDISKVTNMSSMFYNCSELTSLDLSNFDTSKVTNMSSMFYNCSKLTSLDLSNFDTSKVTDMSSMFYNCSELTSLNVSRFDTSKVTTMRQMFAFVEIETLDLSSFDTTNVTTMYGMFYNFSTTSLDLSNFFTPKLNIVGASSSYSIGNSGYGMFEKAKISTIDISNMTFDLVTNNSWTFRNISVPTTIYVKDETVKNFVTVTKTNYVTVVIK